MDEYQQNPQLRKGWTTGACATAAAKAAFISLITGECPDMIDIMLPGGMRPFFSIACSEMGDGFAIASVVKDAGDDPDVTHGAVIKARVKRLAPGKGVVFRAGLGVGTVTKPGLPLPVGEPAINPVPREMMQVAIAEIATLYKVAGDVEIQLSVPNGKQIALDTWNPRLGILGGISILGTTGIVIPYSCSAWIHSIHRGVDVARAAGLSHVAGATGRTSEAAIQKLYGMDEASLIDMGDFVGGLLKYIRRNPVKKLTIAGGFAKMTKLAQGMLDLHSRAGNVDLNFLADLSGIEHIRQANNAKHALEISRVRTPNLAELVAQKAWQVANKVIDGAGVELDVVVFDRDGGLLSRTSKR